VLNLSDNYVGCSVWCVCLAVSSTFQWTIYLICCSVAGNVASSTWDYNKNGDEGKHYHVIIYFVIVVIIEAFLSYFFPVVVAFQFRMQTDELSVKGYRYIECVLFQNLTNPDRSRFVRRDRSSPMKKNTQIFLVVVGVVIWFSSVQSVTDHALFYK